MKPNLRDALLELALVITIIALLLLPGWWELIASVASALLASGGVPNAFASAAQPAIAIRTSSGDVAIFSVLLECSGFVTIGIYGGISALTTGLMRVRLAYKLQWLFAGMGIGLAWNVLRLVLIVSTAYWFGLDAFQLVHYALAPFVDFLWIVVVWTLAMSYLEPLHKEGVKV